MTQKKSEISGNSYVKKIWSNIYIRNIIYAVLLFVAIIFASKWFLSCFTRHGESFPVPDFKGMYIEDVKRQAEEHNLNIEISDSLFVSGSPSGAVLEQHPKANTHVKKNRMIYLTVNCIMPKKVEVPNVVGYSLRQATAVLAGKGIRVGKITYQPDMAMNNVIGQICKDVETKGTVTFVTNEDHITATVFLGDEIELIAGLGNNPDECYTYVPNVTGKDINEAKSILIESYLNTGKIIYDSTVKTEEDKRNSIVKNQYPGGNGNIKSSLGDNVDITMTVKK
ncbi:MAG: PASTA domain-containing protein [Prevotellaceae bacterium]|jgi:beta-lactam-binding protein with PASTA domain|nr:PASTA domain-containing protein [Prevotellaceae bacterium]